MDDHETLRRFGRAMKLARVSRDLSQRELAGKLGCSQNHVWGMEAGKVEPGILLVLRMSKELDLPLTYFFAGINEQLTAVQP